MLTTEQLATRGINASGYKTAQQHYALLKKKFILQTINKVKQEDLMKEYKKSFAELQQIILKGDNTSDESKKLANELLESIEQFADAQLTNQNTQNALKDAYDKITKRKVSSRAKDPVKAYLDRVKKHQDLIFNIIDKQGFLNQIPLPSNGDLQDITNQASSYLLRYLFKKITSNTVAMNKGNYANSLKGYYQEIGDYKLWEKYIDGISNRSGLKVYHAGSGKVVKDGKEIDTELDIVISNLDNLQEILEANEEVKTDILIGSVYDMQELNTNLINKINWFGEQTKAWDFPNKYQRFGARAIGNRAELFKQFLSTPEAQLNEKGESFQALQGMQFLAYYKNILLALGPANVIMGIGGNRMWMCDFIKTFREMQYLLAFDGGRKNPLNQHISLTQLYNKNISVFD